MNKKLISGMLCSMFILSGCSQSTTAYQNNVESKPKKDYVSILNNANKVKIEEHSLSLTKKYDIKVDDETVATIEGKFFNDFGDVFTMKDANGNFLIKESQIKRWGFKATRGAIIQDDKDNTLGYIGEEILDKVFSVGYTFHFYDKDEKEVGISDQVNFSLFKDFTYYDNQNNKDYLIDENLSMFGDSYTITINDKKDIPLYNALLMVTIQDAIYDAKEKQKKEDKKKKSSSTSSNSKKK